MFLVPRHVEGAAVVLTGRTSPEDVRPGHVLVVRQWTPVHVVPLMSAAAVVILARSTTTHAAVVALQLALPGCVVDPALWPDVDPDRVLLNPIGEEVRWWLTS